MVIIGGSILLIVVCCIAGAIAVKGILSNGKDLEASNASTVVTSEKRKQVTVCGESEIIEASRAIEDYDTISLGNIVSRIEKIDDYTYDINCDYILSRYYLMTGDTSLAQKYITEIDLSRTAGMRYSLLFSPPAQPVTALKSSLDVLKYQKDTQNNTPSGTDLDKIDKENVDD